MITIVALAIASACAVHVAMSITDASAARRRFGRARRPSPGDHPLVHRLADRVGRGRRDRNLEVALPNALDGIARSLRSGASLHQAVADAATDAHGTLGADLRRVARDVDDGVPLSDALARWSGDRSLSGVRLATAALALGAETGGASAQAIDGVAATLRINLAIAGDVRALASQARMSALVIVLAPVAFTMLATGTDDRTAAFLFRTPFGLLCLVLGLGLDALGWLWMRRITAGVA